MAIRYARWFMEHGVQRGETVGFYLQNSAEFMFAWLGLAIIGAHPAMINYNLTGDALVHSVKISNSRLILVDDELRDRAEKNEQIQRMGLELVVLTPEVAGEIERMDDAELPSEATSNIPDSTPLALRYTR
jgi:acyl-CoA synthetase (AMP-forming)/AMP-acid ligase II